MKHVNSQNFGLLIAYVIPGLTSLSGLEHFSDTIASWLKPASTAPSVGGFLYATIAAIGCGLFVSAIRWMIIDRIHAATGLRRPEWNIVDLQSNIDAFKMLVEDHYRYYQFYANMSVAMAISYSIQRIYAAVELTLAHDVLLGITIVILILASRDTLRKYYERTGELLKEEASLSSSSLIMY